MEPKLLKAETHVDMRTEIMYRYCYRETEYTRPHYHDYYEVFWVTEGCVKHVMSNGVTAMLLPGDVVFVRPDDIHDHLADGDKSYVMLNITFTAATAKELFSFLGDGFPSKELLSAPLPVTAHLSSSEFASLNTRMKTISAIPLENVDALKTALRVFLFSVFTKYFSAQRLHMDSVPPWLDEALNRMRQGGFVEGAEKLFTLTDRSREHVCRCVKKYMGMTVTEFINDLRLSYIANMLLNSNYTITKIVLDSGFDNISWASLQFKKKYGMTMRDFRDHT